MKYIGHIPPLLITGNKIPVKPVTFQVTSQYPLVHDIQFKHSHLPTMISIRQIVSSSYLIDDNY